MYIDMEVVSHEMKSTYICLLILDPVGSMIQHNLQEKYVFDTSNNLSKSSNPSHELHTVR